MNEEAAIQVDSQREKQLTLDAFTRAKFKHYFFNFYNTTLFMEKLINKQEYHAMKLRIDTRFAEEVSRASTNNPPDGGSDYLFHEAQELCELFSLLNA